MKNTNTNKKELKHGIEDLANSMMELDVLLHTFKKKGKENETKWINDKENYIKHFEKVLKNMYFIEIICLIIVFCSISFIIILNLPFNYIEKGMYF